MRGIFFLFLMLCSWKLVAQVNLHNSSLYKPEIAELYVGAPNVIEVIGLSDYSNLNISLDNTVITKDSANRFFVMVKGTPRIDTLRLYQKRKLLLTKAYKVKYFPNPEARLGIVKDSTATVNQIMAMPSLHVYNRECNFNIRSLIRYFSLTLMNERHVQQAKFDNVNGNNLLAEHINEIKKLKRGSKLIFESIQFIPSGGCPRTLPELTITIL